MKIPFGTKYITECPSNGRVPHERCNKKCGICFLWYAGWRVRPFKFLCIDFLLWENNGLSIKDKNLKNYEKI